METLSYCQLMERCIALAAENAALKQFPEQIVGFIGKLGTSEMGSGTRETIESAAKRIKTPATDAFLAEVRAQGVEMVIAHHRERAEALHHVDRNNAIRHSMSVLDASDVAAKLRQEAAQ